MMKKSNLWAILLLVFGCSLAFMSCENDANDDPQEDFNNQISIDNSIDIDINDGIAAEHGIVDFGGGGEDSTHYAYIFILTDGDIKIYSETPEDYGVDTSDVNNLATYALYLEVMSLGGDAFSIGTFEGLGVDNINTSEPPLINFYNAYLIRDEEGINGEESYNNDENTYKAASINQEGELIITGTGPSDYNLVFNNLEFYSYAGSTTPVYVSGSYNGTLKYHDSK